ncbi:MAG TPA: hypothetical protein VNF99_21545 [Stellaceae bacterium]|nr:hypothetical protein [Stellaceae bacterium]
MQLNASGAAFIAFAMIAAAAGIVATHALAPALLRLADEASGTAKAATPLPTGDDTATQHRNGSRQAPD